MSPFRLAWLNLSRHRVATLLTVITLALGVALAGILWRTWKVADSRFASMVRTGDAILGAKADPVDMTLGALNLEGPYPEYIPLRFAILLNRNWLDKDFSVHITPILFCAKRNGRRVIATTREILTQPDSALGFALAEGVWPETEAGVVLGAETARRERLRLGDTVAVRPWTGGVDAAGPDRRMQVMGILRPMGNAWDGALFTNMIQGEILIGKLDLATWDGDWSALRLHYLLLHVPEGGIPHVRQVVNERTVVQIAVIDDALATLDRLTASGRALGAAIGLLALCLAAVAVAGLLLGRFEGLGRQMITLEAIGYGRGELLTMLACEGLLLGLAAVICGGALDGALFPVFRGLLDGLPGAEIAPSSAWESRWIWVAVPLLAAVLSMSSAALVFRGRAGERLRGLA